MAMMVGTIADVSDSAMLDGLEVLADMLITELEEISEQVGKLYHMMNPADDAQ